MIASVCSSIATSSLLHRRLITAAIIVSIHSLPGSPNDSSTEGRKVVEPMTPARIASTTSWAR